MKRVISLSGVVCLIAGTVWCAHPALAGPPKPATDQETKEMIAGAKESKDYNNADVVYVLDEADVYVQDSGLATTESCQVIKVLTDAGIRSQSVLHYEFDPATNRVAYKSVRVHRQDKTVEDVPVSGVITQPAPQHAIYWGNRQHVLSIPRLEVGDCLEVRVSKTGFNIAYLGEPAGAASGQTGGAAEQETLQPPMPGHWYESTLFQAGYPIIKKRYSVHMPKDKPVQYEVYNGSLKSSLWFGEKHHVYSWWAEDVPAWQSEPYATSWDDNASKLVMATIPDWPMKSRWFHEVNEPQFEADDAIRAKVKELTANLDDEEAKIRACLHWVADNVRYFGTSRGPCEGFTLHKGIETFHDRGGVCKDKAGMLITMLRVLGYEVYPALTMAGSRVEEIPADQFNHTITVMRKKDGTFRILDPTWSPLSRETWSSWEVLQGLVYGTPEGQDLTLSPYYEPEYSTLAGRGTSEITDDGTLSSQIVIDMSGSPCTSFRRTLGRQPVSEQRALFEGGLGIAPTARLADLEHTDPYDYSRDSQVTMEIAAPGYAPGGETVRMFRMPLMSRPLGAFISPDLNYALDAKERKFGLRLRATRIVRYEETIKLPAGWKVDPVPEAKKLDSPSASLTFEATAGEGSLTYKFELRIKHNIIPAKDYVEYKKAIDAMNELRDMWVVCKADKDAPELDETRQAMIPARISEVNHD